MAYTQLKGQIFKRGGVSYLVLGDNDFSAAKVRVKSVDGRRAVCEMPLHDVLQLVGTSEYATHSGRGFGPVCRGGQSVT